MNSGYGYGGMWGGYGGYGNDYYQSTIEDAYDPNKVLQMVGINVGIGKRLHWPDDAFTFQAEIGYQWYYLKNWDYLYYMNNGTSNSIVLGLTLARQSIDQPLYTRRGSIFSVNLQLTPPASLFSGKKDWEKLYKENTVESKKQLYRWIEYWKLRIKSRTYTPLTDPDGKWTLVLMTRADFGLLGSYNKWLKSPFETFYVGGDGMSGSYTYATETIGLRGYENGQFTPGPRKATPTRVSESSCTSPSCCRHRPPSTVLHSSKPVTHGPMSRASRPSTSSAVPVPVCASICLWWV